MLALLATLVGLAMVAGGIYGLVQGDDDDDASASSPADEPGFPLATDARCAQAARLDPRLRTVRDLKLRPAGGTTGEAEVEPICSGTSVQLSIRIKGVRDSSESYTIWLTGNGRRAESIGTMIAGTDGSGFGSGTIDADVDSSDYEQVVVARSKNADFIDPPKRPRKILFSGSL